MRFALTSFVVLFGLMLTAAAQAGDAAKDAEAEPTIPPVEAAAPDTPVAAPAPAPTDPEADESDESDEE